MLAKWYELLIDRNILNMARVGKYIEIEGRWVTAMGYAWEKRMCVCDATGYRVALYTAVTS